MMSIAVKNNDGQYILYSKGADSSLLPRTKFKNQKEKTDIIAAIDSYARKGNRTMVFCRKVMSRNEYMEFKQAMDDMHYITTTEGLNEIYSRFEHNFEFLGASCVEDEL
jgi:phospholipid-translocating ATPase